MGSGKKEVGQIGRWQNPREEVEATGWCGGEHEEGMEWVQAKGIPRWEMSAAAAAGTNFLDFRVRLD